MEKYIRKIVKNGRNSYYINIPKEIAKELKLKERQKLIITRRGGRISIVDYKK
jgi:bifunctional DNA-binding transcriptional regulator/antitoxin component of YhaV-PrlF toxin-antitoxin module